MDPAQAMGKNKTARLGRRHISLFSTIIKKNHVNEGAYEKRRNCDPYE